MVRLNTLALPPNSRGKAVPIIVAVAVLCALVASAIWLVSRSSPQPALSAPTAAHVEQTVPAPPSTTETALDTTTVPEAVAPTTEPPTTAPPVTQPPGPDPAVLATKQLQGQLRDLGYSPGSVDGKFGGRTASAVLAFEKVEGLSLDGEPGPDVLARLAAPQGAVATEGSAVPRIEIDLERQVLFAVTSEGTRIFNTSTGNNEPFTWPDGTPAKAYTPTGHFSVLRRVEGVDDGPLGALYRPLYFYDGWAVHGASYVPAFPASHGCARVSFADQDWIWDNIPNGTPVIVY